MAIVPMLVATNLAGLPTSGLPANAMALTTSDAKRWIWTGAAWEEWIGSLTAPQTDVGEAVPTDVTTLLVADPVKVNANLAALAAKINGLRAVLQAHALMQ